jgi:hypothetical protein
MPPKAPPKIGPPPPPPPPPMGAARRRDDQPQAEVQQRPAFQNSLERFIPRAQPQQQQMAAQTSTNKPVFFLQLVDWARSKTPEEAMDAFLQKRQLPIKELKNLEIKNAALLRAAKESNPNMKKNDYDRLLIYYAKGVGVDAEHPYTYYSIDSSFQNPTLTIGPAYHAYFTVASRLKNFGVLRNGHAFIRSLKNHFPEPLNVQQKVRKDAFKAMLTTVSTLNKRLGDEWISYVDEFLPTLSSVLEEMFEMSITAKRNAVENEEAYLSLRASLSNYIESVRENLLMKNPAKPETTKTENIHTDIFLMRTSPPKYGFRLGSFIEAFLRSNTSSAEMKKKVRLFKETCQKNINAKIAAIKNYSIVLLAFDEQLSEFATKGLSSAWPLPQEIQANFVLPENKTFQRFVVDHFADSREFADIFKEYVIATKRLLENYDAAVPQVSKLKKNDRVASSSALEDKVQTIEAELENLVTETEILQREVASTNFERTVTDLQVQTNLFDIDALKGSLESMQIRTHGLSLPTSSDLKLLSRGLTALALLSLLPLSANVSKKMSREVSKAVVSLLPQHGRIQNEKQKQLVALYTSHAGGYYPPARIHQRGTLVPSSLQTQQTPSFNGLAGIGLLAGLTGAWLARRFGRRQHNETNPRQKRSNGARERKSLLRNQQRTLRPRAKK